MGYRSWGHIESVMTEKLTLSISLFICLTISLTNTLCSVLFHPERVLNQVKKEKNTLSGL